MAILTPQIFNVQRSTLRLATNDDNSPTFMLTSLLGLTPRAPSQNTLIADAQSDRCVRMGALSFITWDALIHLADEVEYIWQGPTNWIKFIYLFIRYFPILAEGSLLTITASDLTGAHFSERWCHDWVSYEAAIVGITTLAVEIVLIVRIFALYNHNRTMVLVLSMLFLGEITTMVTSLVRTVQRMMQFDAQCLSITTAPDIYMAYWLSCLAFETVLFALTLISLFSSVRHGLGRHSILYVFLRDGTWAFALIFVIMLLNTLMYRLNDPPLAGICYTWAISVMSFAGAHVLLNIQRLGRPSEGQITTTGSVLISGLVFVAPDRSEGSSQGGTFGPAGEETQRSIELDLPITKGRTKFDDYI